MSPPMPSGLKELTPVGYLGIDFGTSNTHLAVCYLDGNNVPQTVPLTGKASVPTCLLWKGPEQPGGDEEVVAFGAKALRDWLNLRDADRARHRFAAAFKPDIASGERAALAQRDARAFLAKCCQAVRDGGVVRLVGSQEGMPVVIGVPAEIGRAQKDLTARLAREAGFGEATAVEEPLGALAFHLADSSVTPAEVRRGVVVVDFGGGTLDVAWLDARHGLREPWGDPTLGGRLFDDLFYQWLLEQNPDLDLPERDRLYVWQAACRDLKEQFSSFWKEEGPDAAFVAVVQLPGRRFAELRDATPAEFLRRASRYAPSPLAGAYFASVGGRLAELGRDGPVDLIGRIRAELARGLEGRRRDIARVILTGGSSNWPFLRDLAAEVFGFDKGRVLLSPQPETTVGSGLAVYHVLKFRNGQKQLKLHGELPEYKRRFEEAVARKIDQFAEEEAAAVVAPLKAQVEAAYLDWYRNGGTLNAVQQQVEAFTGGFDVAACLRGHDLLLARDLVRLVRDHLSVWLKEHGIDREADELAPDGAIAGLEVPRLGDQAGAIARIISDLVGVALVGAVFGIVYTAVHGTHILVHPLTGIPTALLSALASAVGFTLVEDNVRRGVMAYTWGSVSLKALSLRLSEKGLRDEIAKNCDKAGREIASLLRHGPPGPGAAPAAGGSALPPPHWKTLDELQIAVVAQFEQVVAQAIRDLGVLEEIRKVGK